MISTANFMVKLVASLFMVVCFASVYAQDDSSGADSSIPGHEGKEKGSKYYKAKDYDKALPYLQVAAEWGFKDAQVRLGQIYLKGLGDVEKNKLRGLAWIGTAASKPSDESYVKMYERELAKVPEEHKASVQSAVAAYTQRYGNKAAAVTCRMKRPLGSNMAKLSCDYDADYKYTKPKSSLWSDHEANSF